MTLKDDTENAQPKCPSCGGGSFSFAEIFGPHAARKLASLSYEPLAQSEERILGELLKLEKQLVQDIEDAERIAKGQLQELKTIHREKLHAIKDGVERELADATSEDDVLGYLMGDEEKDGIIHRRQADIERQFVAQKEKLAHALSLARRKITEGLRNQKSKHRSELASKNETFLEMGEPYTLSLIFCDECGTPISACPSPRVTSGSVSRQTQALLASLADQRALAEQSLNESLDRLEKIATGINEANQVVVQSTENIIQALSQIAGILQGVKTASLISGIAHVGDAVDEVQDMLDGDGD